MLEVFEIAILEIIKRHGVGGMLSWEVWVGVALAVVGLGLVFVSYLFRQEGLRQAHVQRSLLSGYVSGLLEKPLSGVHVALYPAHAERIPQSMHADIQEVCAKGGGHVHQACARRRNDGQCVVAWTDDFHG